MKIDRNLPGLTSKDSSTKAVAPLLPSATMIPFAHYLGLPSRVSETAKALPGKAVAAMSRTLGRKPAPAAMQIPQASRPATPSAPAPIASASNASIVKQAIAAERARAAQILAAGIKAGQVHTACAFACDTDMTAEQAIAAINAGARDTASQTGNGRGRRMGLDPDQPTGSTAHREPTAKELAAQIVAAGEKAAGHAPSSGASTPMASRIIAAGARARGEAA